MEKEWGMRTSARSVVMRIWSSRGLQDGESRWLSRMIAISGWESPGQSTASEELTHWSRSRTVCRRLHTLARHARCLILTLEARRLSQRIKPPSLAAFSDLSDHVTEHSSTFCRFGQRTITGPSPHRQLVFSSVQSKQILTAIDIGILPAHGSFSYIECFSNL